jgi:hypothetical protein
MLPSLTIKASVNPNPRYSSLMSAFKGLNGSTAMDLIVVVVSGRFDLLEMKK